MGKNNYIKLEFDAHAYILGIASTDKIWKVVWVINTELGLDMSTGAQDVTAASGMELYQDIDSDPDFEYTLFENSEKSRKVSKKAREFRFWLALKPKREKVPDLENLIRRLRGLGNISLVVDLTDEENIQKLMP